MSLLTTIAAALEVGIPIIYDQWIELLFGYCN
jgi:hypothetical protein